MDPRVATCIRDVSSRRAESIIRAAAELGRLAVASEPAIPALLEARRDSKGLFLLINAPPEQRDRYLKAASTVTASLKKIQESLDKEWAEREEAIKLNTGPMISTKFSTMSWALKNDPDPWIRAYAARVVGEWGVEREAYAPTVEHDLQAAFKDKAQKVREAAAEALTRFRSATSGF